MQISKSNQQVPYRQKVINKNEHEYVKAEDYYADRALYGIQAPFLDMDGRIIFTRSEEEKKYAPSSL